MNEEERRKKLRESIDEALEIIGLANDLLIEARGSLGPSQERHDLDDAQYELRRATKAITKAKRHAK